MTKPTPLTKPKSRYVHGGETSYIPETRVGWWEMEVFEHKEDDIFFTITPETAHNPMLISHKVYKTPAYSWMVLQYNTIVDLNEELKVGDVIRLPSFVRLNFELLNNKLGGIDETEQSRK
jgi:hypothetical protein